MILSFSSLGFNIRLLRRISGPRTTKAGTAT
jgi:hypothetical protein